MGTSKPSRQQSARAGATKRMRAKDEETLRRLTRENGFAWVMEQMQNIAFGNASGEDSPFYWWYQKLAALNTERKQRNNAEVFGDDPR